MSLGIVTFGLGGSATNLLIGHPFKLGLEELEEVDNSTSKRGGASNSGTPSVSPLFKPLRAEEPTVVQVSKNDILPATSEKDFGQESDLDKRTLLTVVGDRAAIASVKAAIAASTTEELESVFPTQEFWSDEDYMIMMMMMDEN